MGLSLRVAPRLVTQEAPACLTTLDESTCGAKATRFIHIDRALRLLADAKRATLVSMTTAE